MPTSALEGLRQLSREDIIYTMKTIAIEEHFKIPAIIEANSGGAQEKAFKLFAAGSHMCRMNSDTTTTTPLAPKRTKS